MHAVAATLGLSALFTSLQTLYDAVRWVGGAYLFYLAVTAFRDRSGLGGDDEDAAAQSPGPAWGTRVATCIPGTHVGARGPDCRYLDRSALRPTRVAAAAQSPRGSRA
ncbi:LysE family translocator [Streptomyces niveus]|uniref:LysE family translocator n=1 Tax=Streptomyces niveus TaxID=193462 RepID=UPI0034337D3E